MEQQAQLVLEPLLEQSLVSRRKLLPVWIKVFIWIFMISGAVVPFAVVGALFGFNFQIALYGLESTYPLNPIGLLLCALFLLKGIAALVLWTERDWAVNIAIADAIVGIAVCAFVMFIYPFIDDVAGFTVNIRLELALLIPYLLKLQKIRPLWRRNLK